MGHYCRLCGRQRPNEAFSGKGHRSHICKKCACKPKEERDAMLQSEEIFGFMEQSHISARNVSRLKVLSGSSNRRTTELAALVLAVAAIKPYKKGRLKLLEQRHGNLLQKLEETGLILARGYCGDEVDDEEWEVRYPEAESWEELF